MASAAEITEKMHWSYQLQGRKGFYIALNDLNLAFTPDEIDVATEMWHEGRPLADIAATLLRRDTEIACLVMDLADNGVISRRPGGIYGEVR